MNVAQRSFILGSRSTNIFPRILYFFISSLKLCSSTNSIPSVRSAISCPESVPDMKCALVFFTVSWCFSLFSIFPLSTLSNPAPTFTITVSGAFRIVITPSFLCLTVFNQLVYNNFNKRIISLYNYIVNTFRPTSDTS